MTMAFCAVGCSGSLFESKTAPAAIYLLSADLAPPAAVEAPSASGSPARTFQALPVDLVVQRPRVRAGLDTERIAVLYPDRRLDYLANARWSGPLDEVMQDLAVQAFDTGARLRTVTSDASAFPGAYWLEIDVGDFEAEYASAGLPPTIRVRLRARLGRAAERRVLSAFDAESRRPAADNRLTAIVAAYGHAVDAALEEIVEDTARTLAELSQHPPAGGVPDP